MRKLDLVGEKFNMLTVLEYIGKSTWKCKCDCGNIINVTTSHLRSGHTTSCGCRHRKQVTDLSGMKFGKLMPISYYRKDNRTYWHCKCDCGNEIDVLAQHLVNGHTKSCGCLRKKDLTGKEYGRLIVISYAGKNKDNRNIWHCRCSCGNELDVLQYDLTCGKVKSCGCNSKKLKDITGKRFGNLVAIKRVGIKNNSATWLCKCDCGNEKVIREGSLQQGLTRSCGCLSTNFSGSLGENEIKDYIATLTDEKPQKVKILDGKEIDLYYEKHNVGIEYNGSVFHASIGNVYNDKDKYYHRDKFMCAKEHGIHLINIFDVDWETNKERIKTLLRYMFYDNTKLYARKCIVKEIDKYTAKMFCNKYHLKGFTPISTIYYGLYYKDELVSVMTFGRMRGKKKSNTDFEMVRYCVKEDYNIIGGANKLLKAFEKEYNPKLVVSYSDNDYFTGDIYTKLGFENDGQCTINYYWYSDRVGEIKREACQVKKLKELYPELYREAIGGVEDYIMSALGSRKVYRCGNTRWIKKY